MRRNSLEEPVIAKAPYMPGAGGAESKRQISGVYPHLAMGAHFGPPRSECGIGAMMPWCGKLYAITYLSHTRKTGSGAGLYCIDADMNMTACPESVPGTYANRFIHVPTDQLFIGPHVIDRDHKIRTIDELVDIRLTGTATHLKDPENLVYMLGMEGEFYEVNVHTLEVVPLDRLVKTLGVCDEGYAHFKAMYSAFGRVIVCNNSYTEEDYLGNKSEGRLAEWDGEGEWKVIDKNPYIEVAGRGRFGGTIFATGWDPASAILQAYTSKNSQWTRYRLPKSTQCFDHAWQTEWPRIREVEHERFLMDHHGMWYELSPHTYNNRVWGLRPISTHLWVHADFCSWNGLLVVGCDNASPAHTSNAYTAEPVSNLWFGKTDDLWQYGKPSGWGGPWWQTQVEAGVASDPYLMTGFDQKCLHLTADDAGSASVTIEVDFRGDGEFRPYQTIGVDAGGYACHVFPAGFSAHWVRLRTDRDGVFDGQFVYS